MSFWVEAAAAAARRRAAVEAVVREAPLHSTRHSASTASGAHRREEG